MNSMRRAALRAATSASRVPAGKPQMLGLVAQSVNASFVRTAVPVAVRCFSQTLRVANEGSASGPGESADHVNSLSTADSPDVSASATPQASDAEGFGIFIRNMVFEANEDHLKEAYERYGKITKVAIARDSRGLSRGYGFVWFDNVLSMQNAVSSTDSSFWHGRRIQVSPRAPKARDASAHSSGPSKSLYVGNIPYETTDAELNRIFRDLENVTDVRVAVDRTTGWPRGFAHADFKDVESCTAAMQKLAGTTIGGRELRLDYAAGNGKPTN